VAKKNILVIDDDPQIRELLQTRLESGGYEVATAADGEDGLAALKRKGGTDLILTDLRMPVMNGLEFLRHLAKGKAAPPVIVLTAYGSVAEAVEAMKLGAYDFLEKPYSGADLLDMVQRALESGMSITGAEDPDEDQLLMGRSPAMQKVIEVIERIAPTPSSVLITGESGTGKELVARSLHAGSERATSSMVVIDCGALPDSLLESELFGHRKGSFTSATQDNVGLLETADGGTVFLDEIGNISLPMQTRLLRFLQNGEVRRVGDTAPRKVNVRVIAATNRDLAVATSEGSFREDLYYRLEVVTIALPPLRQRREDIPILAEFFLAQAARQLRRGVDVFGAGVLDLLAQHGWPGNVRQLKHVVEAGVALSRGKSLELQDLSHSGFTPVADSIISAEADGLSRLERQEREQILSALRASSWVQKRAADALGISGRVIHYKIRKYGIQIPRS
jgi:DNA-binding NtrC family response regulator